MNKLFLSVLFFLFACQNKSKSDINDIQTQSKAPISNAAVDDNTIILQKEVIRYIPDSMEILDTCIGNLNLDNLDDLIVVLKTKNEEEREDVYENPNRPLLIFIKQEDGKYKYKGENSKLVQCVRCGGAMGDPFMDVVIKNGYFSVEHFGGSRERWAQTTTFKYNKVVQNWQLHKDAEEVIDVMVDEGEEPKSTRSIMKTTNDFGIVNFEDYSNEIILE